MPNIQCDLSRMEGGMTAGLPTTDAIFTQNFKVRDGGLFDFNCLEQAEFLTGFWSKLKIGTKGQCLALLSALLLYSIKLMSYAHA